MLMLIAHVLWISVIRLEALDKNVHYKQISYIYNFKLIYFITYYTILIIIVDVML